ncbi:MAG: carbamoyl-phosphate synthase (glutamine-hydrolyzing) small subunit, partial [Bacteroidales bacterium]|nr:carbamoyl-phosphate synthase (glutamine-hydrolyzing) small subunit [Bacteroidales bacterium]
GAGSVDNILETVSSITELLNKNIPVFGVSLGHQVLAKAKGLNVEKLKFGHRGANLPVKYQNSDRVYITNQNHGYCGDKSSLTKSCKLTFTNVNDGSVEGISYDDKCMSVQFMPICDKGPHDTSFIYDEFITLIGEGK